MSHFQEGFDSSGQQFLTKQQSLDGVSLGSRSGGSAVLALRGSPVIEGSSLERPRQLGLSRSQSFVSGPPGTGSERGLAEFSSGAGDRGLLGRHAHHHHLQQHHHHQAAPADSLEVLATPMLNRRHRHDNLERRHDSCDRFVKILMGQITLLMIGGVW